MLNPHSSQKDGICCVKGTTVGNTEARVLWMQVKTSVQLLNPAGPDWVMKMPPGLSFSSTTFL